MRHMFSAWAVCLAAAAPMAQAATYYVDAVAGSDSNSGLSATSAWRSLDKVAQESSNRKVRKSGFAAGDQILFRRGQTFQSSGYPIIRVAGTATAPVVLDAWGIGEAPKFDNTGPNVYDLVMKVDGNYALLRNLAFIKSDASNVTEFGAYMAGRGHRITACDFSGVGIGVKLEGSGHRVDSSAFHDLTMVVNDTVNRDNDYGAIGVLVSGASDINVDHNRFDRLRAASPDYGVDGSALEIFNAASRVRFFNNIVQEVAALTEIGGSVPTDVVTDIVYHHNLVINANSIGYFHNNAGNTTFGVVVNNVRFEHNTFSKTSDAYNTFLLGFGVPPAANEFFLRNNIIEHRNSSGLFYNSGQLVHQANLYWLTNANFGDAGFAFTATELSANPLFRNPAGGDYRLSVGSMAVDRGQELGYTVDLDELGMPVGNGPDLGAYELR
jgi:hypothetical protein